MKIIKSFVLSGAFALVSLGASAQAVFGVKAGANLGVVYGTAEEQGGNKIESVSPNLGFQGGLFAAKDLSESIGLMVELNYELKRGNKEISEFTLNQTTYASALQSTVEAVSCVHFY